VTPLGRQKKLLLKLSAIHENILQGRLDKTYFNEWAFLTQDSMNKAVIAANARKQHDLIFYRKIIQEFHIVAH
jgi:hypothetical protein